MYGHSLVFTSESFPKDNYLNQHLNLEKNLIRGLAYVHMDNVQGLLEEREKEKNKRKTSFFKLRPVYGWWLTIISQKIYIIFINYYFFEK